MGSQWSSLRCVCLHLVRRRTELRIGMEEEEAKPCRSSRRSAGAMPDMRIGQGIPTPPVFLGSDAGRR